MAGTNVVWMTNTSKVVHPCSVATCVISRKIETVWFADRTLLTRNRSYILGILTILFSGYEKAENTSLPIYKSVNIDTGTLAQAAEQRTLIGTMSCMM